MLCPGLCSAQHLTPFPTHHLCHALQVQAVLQRKEEEDRQTQRLVQALQAALDAERQTVRSLKEQVRGSSYRAGGGCPAGVSSLPRVCWEQRCHLSTGDKRRLEPQCSSVQEGSAGPRRSRAQLGRAYCAM